MQHILRESLLSSDFLNVIFVVIVNCPAAFSFIVPLANFSECDIKPH